MFQSFLIAFNSVFPFVFYMALGYGLVRLGFTDKPFLSRLNTFVFKAFFPFIMFKNVYYVETELSVGWLFLFCEVVGILGLIGLLVLIVPRFVKEDARRGVVIQGIYRSNVALFAVPLSEFIYGSEGAMLTAVMASVAILIFNVTAVIILEYYRGGEASLPALAKKIATNPLIIGVLSGFLFHALRIPIPDLIGGPVKTIASIGTPLALIALGGTLEISAFRKNAAALTSVCLFKMVIIPIVSYLLTLLLPFTNMERFLLLVIFFTPAAVSSYTMAENMGGDGPLAGQIVVSTTLVSVVSIFCFVFIFDMLGILY